MKHLLGKEIGGGCRRLVYVHKEDPSLVIKVYRDKSFFVKHPQWKHPEHNVREYENWLLSQKKGVSEWLAPCVTISDCGIYLVQVRGTSVQKIPHKVPGWIMSQGDYTYAANWVEIDGRTVLSDYGSVRFFKGRK